MSDPVTNVEIEDVLSSIRRLVSEETRKPDLAEPAARRTRGVDRLVLTPSLRVSDPPKLGPVQSDPQPDDGAPPSPEAVQMDDVQEAAAPLEALAEAAMPADDTGWDGQATDASDPVPDPEGGAPDPDPHPIEVLERGDAPDAPSQDGADMAVAWVSGQAEDDVQDSPEEAVIAQDPSASAGTFVLMQDDTVGRFEEAPAAHWEPAPAAEAEASHPLQSIAEPAIEPADDGRGDDQDDAAIATVAPQIRPDAQDEDGAAAAHIEPAGEPGQEGAYVPHAQVHHVYSAPPPAADPELVDLVTEGATQDDAASADSTEDSAADPAAAETTIGWEETAEGDQGTVEPVLQMPMQDSPLAPQGHAPASASDAVQALTVKLAELEAKIGQHRAAGQGQPAAAPQNEPIEMAQWRDNGVESPVDDASAKAEAEAALQDAQAANADIFGTDETILDEDTLRELVTDIVREELQGALGERITRNVRKLVRREIHRALTAQDFE